MVAVAFYGALVAVIAVVGYLRFFFRLRKKGEPPICSGHFLWGNGKEFALNAVAFIHKQQAKLGDIFTIRLLNQHLTIINDPHTYERVCKERNFDFDPIQKQVNHNVFGFELADARNMIKEAGKKVKGNYLTSNMVNFSGHLNESFTDSLTNLGSDGWHSDGLRSMTSRTMFRSIFRTIFGVERSSDVFEPITVYKSFDVFHKYFNYLWLGLPIKLFPRACRALDVLVQMPSSEEFMGRDDVSEYIKYSTQFMLNHNQTESDIIGHNLVYLHVNYNTFRVQFWMSYYLAQHADAREALLREVNDLIKSKEELYGPDEAIEITMEDISRMDVLDSIVKETIRTTSGVFMVRSITKDTSFTMDSGETYNLRAGDRVAMYPPALHKHPEIFENPLEFKYDRFCDNAKFYKDGREVKTPLLAFGSLCPGKQLAIAQVKWCTLNLVHRFDFEVADGETCMPDNNYHGHEILPPTNDVKLLYKPRSDSRTLCFAA